MTNWIKTSDRMPENGAHVLVYGRWYDDWFVAGATVEIFPNSNQVFWCLSYRPTHGTESMDEVTHWQPLPEPPAE